MLIHGSLACNKCYNSARSYLIQRLCKEIIMYLEVKLIIGLVADLIISERYVSDRHIKEIILEVGLFISADTHICLRIELLCDTACQIIKLNSV